MVATRNGKSIADKVVTTAVRRWMKGGGRVSTRRRLCKAGFCRRRMGGTVCSSELENYMHCQWSAASAVAAAA